MSIIISSNPYRFLQGAAAPILTILRFGWRLGVGALLLVLLTASARATSWYVDNSATGANNGTSWANAWTSYSHIQYNAGSGIRPGDTVYFSGGPVGGTGQVYTDPFGSQGAFAPVNGTSGNPVTYAVGQDVAHGGYVIFDGGGDPHWMYADSASNNYFPINYIHFNGNYNGQCHMIVQNYGNVVMFDDNGGSRGMQFSYIRAYGCWRGYGCSIYLDHCVVGPFMGIDGHFRGFSAVSGSGFGGLSGWQAGTGSFFSYCTFFACTYPPGSSTGGDGDDYFQNIGNTTISNCNFISIYTSADYITTSFTQPPVGGTIQVPFSSTSGLSVGMKWHALDAIGYKCFHCNLYLITAINGNSVTLQNLGIDGNTLPGNTVAISVSNPYTWSQHQDGVQTSGQVWFDSNYLENISNYGFYGEFFGNGGNQVVINNVFNYPDPEYVGGSTFPVAIGTSASNVTINNILCANNTCANGANGISVGGGQAGARLINTLICNNLNYKNNGDDSRCPPNFGTGVTLVNDTSGSTTGIQFVSNAPYPNQNFQLTSASTSAIGLGTSAPASSNTSGATFNYDALGVTRTSPWTVGAYQSSAGASPQGPPAVTGLHIAGP